MSKEPHEPWPEQALGHSALTEAARNRAMIDFIVVYLGMGACESLVVGGEGARQAKNKRAKF